MHYLFTFFVLFSTHFSQAYELVSLDIDKKNFEFDPKDLVISESFVPVYIDAYISRQYKNIPFLISLLFEDLTSSKWYSYFFIFDNDKFVNYEHPGIIYYCNKITKGSGIYYKIYDPLSNPIGNEKLIEDIAKGNLITQGSSVIEEVDMKSIIIKLKMKAKSGSIVTYTSKCKGTLSERSRCLCDCFRGEKSTTEPYRYKLFSSNVANE
ncbi:hypothetical protein BdWA1_001506 [Babesia duncani]|uniref:Uncharacterized protein n=1 Tax=Babesia duncani TaxID=323732 RepID=A0AAD9PK80_9APIC|nr:hypothetical protein BdWA1_001506 [Babesia duncani]